MATIKYKPLETWKAHERRVREGFYQKYVNGVGLDVGCSHDPIGAQLAFPSIKRDDPIVYPSWSDGTHKTWPHESAPRLYVWDKEFGDGDAHELAGIPAETFDYVHASHLLEHLEDPIAFLRRAFEVLKPGGYLLLLVPHRDRYENKRLLPSRWNEDHKSFWLPEEHDPPHTWGLRQVLEQAFYCSEMETHDCDGTGGEPGDGEIEYIRVCDEGWTKPKEGEHAGGEYSIEAVIKKL